MMAENKVTFGIPGSVVFDMDMKGGPLPRGLHPPNNLDATVVVTCTEQEARAMAAWLARQPDKSAEYEGVVKLIDLTLWQQSDGPKGAGR
jgi:hypothetical protein